MVVYFHRIGFSGVSANAIVVPLMCAVIPVGFIAIFTGWGWVAKAAGWLLAASHAAVSWHMHLEPNWRIPTPPLWLGIAIGLGPLACWPSCWRCCFGIPSRPKSRAINLR